MFKLFVFSTFCQTSVVNTYLFTVAKIILFTENHNKKKKNILVFFLIKKNSGRSLHRDRPRANIYVNNQKVLLETVSDRDAHGILHHIGSEQIGKVKFCPEKTNTYTC